MKKTFLFFKRSFSALSLSIFFFSCGGGSGNSNGSQDNLIPTGVPQNGVLGSWYVQSGNISGVNKIDIEPSPISSVEVDVFAYIESDRFTVVSKCSFEDGSQLTAVASASASITDSVDVPDVKQLHTLDRKVSRVIEGKHWCTASITPSTMSLQLESNFTLRMWNQNAVNVFLSRIE